MDDNKNRISLIMFKKLLYPLFILVYVTIALLYYNYQENQIPKMIKKSDNTMMLTNAMRFTFKVSILTNKSLVALTKAFREQDEESLYDAQDYIDAAEGFLLTGYMADLLPIKEVQPLIKSSKNLMETSGLNMTAAEFHTIDNNIKRISYLTEQAETKIWIKFQKKFIAFQTNEYKLHHLYQFIAFSVFLLLVIFIWNFIKQKHLYNKIQEHEKKLASLAYYDSLTKIPNRQTIEAIIDENINRSKRDGSEFYIALIDLDDFKKVNDTHGHDAGDKVLVECVKRIKSAIRDSDVLGRFGGDEFIIVFANTIDISEISTILKRLHTTFNEALSFDSIQYYTNISIGAVNYPHQATSKSELIKYADIAMYHSKSMGKGQSIFFQDNFSKQIEYQYKMEPEIKNALENSEFELYYQPQVKINNNSTISVEALVRWNHPTKGFLPPSAFIEIIENGFLTKEFGEWVIKEAAKQQKIWLSKGIDITISVNLSVKHIMASTFYNDITKLVEDLHIDLTKFYFEITEYELMKYHDNSAQMLNKLAEKGFSFHLDDFGTGYSSITYLSDIKINAIKIDKKFIDDIHSLSQRTALVDAIVTMAQALKIIIIAEGVENKVQYDYLKKLHCDIIQGYYFSKPLSAKNFEKYAHSS